MGNCVQGNDSSDELKIPRQRSLKTERNKLTQVRLVKRYMISQEELKKELSKKSQKKKRQFSFKEIIKQEENSDLLKASFSDQYSTCQCGEVPKIPNKETVKKKRCH